MRSRSVARIAPPRCLHACIRPVSPATCWARSNAIAGRNCAVRWPRWGRRARACYLNQEGRGIGLANKMRAYSLQDQGFDTVEANHRLGFEDDERDFRLGAEILRSMGFAQIRLLTNNPAKVAMMDQSGVRVVERVPLKVGLNPLNAKYLDTKAKKSGHIL